MDWRLPATTAETNDIPAVTTTVKFPDKNSADHQVWVECANASLGVPPRDSRGRKGVDPAVVPSMFSENDSGDEASHWIETVGRQREEEEEEEERDWDYFGGKKEV